MVRQRLGAWTQGKGRNELGAGVAGHPEPRGFGGATEFVEVDMRQLEGAQEPVMQGVRVLAGA
jgi:hypothetical protein